MYYIYLQAIDIVREAYASGLSTEKASAPALYYYYYYYYYYHYYYYYYYY